MWAQNNVQSVTHAAGCLPLSQMFLISISLWQGRRSTEDKVLTVSFSSQPGSNAKPCSLSLGWMDLGTGCLGWRGKALPGLWCFSTPHLSMASLQDTGKWGMPHKFATWNGRLSAWGTPIVLVGATGLGIKWGQSSHSGTPQAKGPEVPAGRRRGSPIPSPKPARALSSHPFSAPRGCVRLAGASPSATVTLSVTSSCSWPWAGAFSSGSWGGGGCCLLIVALASTGCAVCSKHLHKCSLQTP